MMVIAIILVISCASARYVALPSGYGGNNPAAVQNAVRSSPPNRPVDYTNGGGSTNTDSGTGNTGLAQSAPAVPAVSSSGSTGTAGDQGATGDAGDVVLGNAPVANIPIAAPAPFNPFSSPQAAASPPSAEVLNSLPQDSPPLLSSPVAGSGSGSDGCAPTGQSAPLSSPAQSAPTGEALLGTILIPISGGAAASSPQASAPVGQASPPNVGTPASTPNPGSGGYPSRRH